MTPKQKRYHVVSHVNGETIMEAETDSLVEASRLSRHFALQGIRFLPEGDVFLQIRDREENRDRLYREITALLWNGIAAEVKATE